MLLHLIELLAGSEAPSWLRAFRDPPARILAAGITALLLSLALGPWCIARLRARQLGQVIRNCGPASHKKKAGTPTMGGALILSCVVVSTLLWCDLGNRLVWLALGVAILYGAIGFADDHAKVTRKHALGLSAKVRILLELAVAAAAMSYLFLSDALPPDVRRELQLPFTSFHETSPTLAAWLYIAFGTLVVVGAANAVNLTDGLDGLAIGPTIINAGTFLVFAYVAGAETTLLVEGGGRETLAQHLHVAHVPGAAELAVLAAALLGAGIGFLWFNTYPAAVFMGDIGSLSIGGLIGMLAVLTKHELTLLLCGGLFVIEALSGIIQMTSLKLRRKRVFRMAPLHHHYELGGWEEPTIIVRFWLVSVVLGLLALATLGFR